MRWRIIWLAGASLCCSVVLSFSVYDDLFAFPQYEILFSEKYTTEEDAKIKLELGGSPSLEAGEGVSLEAPQPSESSTGSDVSMRPSRDGADEGGAAAVGSLSYQRMILKNRPYLCSVPQPRELKNETKEEVSQEEEIKELARATAKGWELLKGMKGNCMYYQSGWWSYSFCYQTEVKQFHPLSPTRGGQASYPPVEDTRVPSFILGEFSAKQQDAKQAHEKSKKAKKDDQAPTDSGALAIRKKGDTRYMVQQLGGGSICDLTGKPRKVEVQFHCHPQSTDRIGWIKETATCAYLMVIYTPRLCNDVAFLPPKEHKAAPIVCSEILAESQLAAWNARAAARVENFLLGASASDTARVPVRPVVGGIEVGGMKQVGAEGQRISAPRVVEQIPSQGQLIAQYDPNKHDGAVQVLPDRHLRDLGLDPDMVEQFQDEISQSADGRPWKLEIVEMSDGGREVIGIVERADGEEEEMLYGEQEPVDEQAQDQDQQQGSKEKFKDEL